MHKLVLLGFGTVGQGVWRILEETPALKERFEIVRILVRDKEKSRATDVPEALLTEDAATAFREPADLIVEVTGEVDGIRDQMAEALRDGKHIVTANKALVSSALEELEDAAAAGRASLLYEAAVAGAVPVVKGVFDAARVRPVDEVQGILNGTCNFILSRMEQGESYSAALKKAQEAGFAEADPSADVEGFDTQRKLRILATLGFHATVKEEQIPCRGIAELKAEDLELLQRHGRRVKLMGIAVKKDRRVTARVLPVCLPSDDPFSAIEGSDNRVRIVSDYPHELSWAGPGAGMYPTAHAVWNDILDVFSGRVTEAAKREDVVDGSETAMDRYYLRAENMTEEDFSDIPAETLDDAWIVGPVTRKAFEAVVKETENAAWALWME